MWPRLLVPFTFSVLCTLSQIIVRLPTANGRAPVDQGIGYIAEPGKSGYGTILPFLHVLLLRWWVLPLLLASRLAYPRFLWIMKRRINSENLALRIKERDGLGLGQSWPSGCYIFGWLFWWFGDGWLCLSGHPGDRQTASYSILTSKLCKQIRDRDPHREGCLSWDRYQPSHCARVQLPVRCVVYMNTFMYECIIQYGYANTELFFPDIISRKSCCQFDKVISRGN